MQASGTERAATMELRAPPGSGWHTVQGEQGILGREIDADAYDWPKEPGPLMACWSSAVMGACHLPLVTVFGGTILAFVWTVLFGQLSGEAAWMGLPLQSSFQIVFGIYIVFWTCNVVGRQVRGYRNSHSDPAFRTGEIVECIGRTGAPLPPSENRAVLRSHIHLTGNSIVGYIEVGEKITVLESRCTRRLGATMIRCDKGWTPAVANNGSVMFRPVDANEGLQERVFSWSWGVHVVPAGESVPATLPGAYKLDSLGQYLPLADLPVHEIDTPGVPRRLFVSGAGSPEVNGEYILCDPGGLLQMYPMNNLGAMLWRQAGPSGVEPSSTLSVIHTVSLRSKQLRLQASQQTDVERRKDAGGLATIGHARPTTTKPERRLQMWRLSKGLGWSGTFVQVSVAVGTKAKHLCQW